MRKGKKIEKETELEAEREFSRPLGDVAKRARTELKLTQGQVAEQMGIDPRTILNIENYRGNPTMESLYPLIRFYGIDPREIFYSESVHDSQVQKRLQLLLASCTESEAEAMLPIVRAVLDALRSHSTELPDDAT